MSKKVKNIEVVGIFFIKILLVSFLFLSGCDHLKVSDSSGFRKVANFDITYNENVKHILDNRCVACHACLESPCQLNLQSYEGVLRGGSQESVYGTLRLKQAELTRMFEDEKTTEAWRKKGFHEVLGLYDFEKEDHNSILLDYVAKVDGKRDRPETIVKESLFCFRSRVDSMDIQNNKSNLSMPYGLPSLKKSERDTLVEWVKNGFPYSKNSDVEIKKFEINDSDKDLISSWEKMLNGNDLKSKITARYLFEHLYLAHFYFSSNDDFETPPQFYKLVRSKTKCEKGVDTISSRTPNSDPGVSSWSYCFVKDIATVANKNHMPYNGSLKKLNWLKKLFMDSNWTPSIFPSFEKTIATNPFVTFKEIPTEVKYRFLLEDAYFHISTFIKGPVCNGNSAVNSIQEQFYTFFIDPKSDLMTMDKNYKELIEKEVILPGVYENDENIASLFSNYSSITKGRSKHEALKRKLLEKNFSNGFSLKDIWNGDGVNDNAALTIFRHGDNSKVAKGAVGDLSKTVFVVDYAIFEKLVYNLVVNFDVYGGIKHRYLTRLYMDFLRMESENNFLQFLPKAQRTSLKKSWYKGSILTQKQLDALSEYDFSNNEVQIKYKTDNPKLELIQNILFDHLKNITAVHEDRINWNVLNHLESNNEEENILKKIAAKKEKFVRFFSDLSYLFIVEDGKISTMYNLVHNVEHTNIAWVFSESSRLAPDEDTLVVSKEFLGSYPNQFMKVNRSDLDKFVSDLEKVNSKKDYKRFLTKYGVDRMDAQFWEFYDFANSFLEKQNPIEAGKLDLSRYEL